MAKTAIVNHVRKVLAEVTGALEDATLIAADGQGVLDAADARLTCDRLIAAVEKYLTHLKRLRRRLQ